MPNPDKQDKCGTEILSAKKNSTEIISAVPDIRAEITSSLLIESSEASSHGI
jgi:hypothetical protein